MKSIIICLRLNQEEISWLDKYREGHGSNTRSDYLRYLLHHERAKRVKLDSRSKIEKPASWDGAFRNGRPRLNHNTISTTNNQKG